jgi:hypothetical protein
VCFFGQVVSKAVIAQKSSYFGIVDEEYFQFTEVEQLVSMFAVPVADVSVFFGEGNDFVLRHEEPELVGPCPARYGASLRMNAHNPLSLPPCDIISQKANLLFGMRNQGLFH